MICVNLCYIASGIVLISAVRKIKQLFDEYQLSHGTINIKMLCIHSAAFGLFLMGSVIFTVANVVYLAKPTIKVEVALFVCSII